MTTSRQPHAKPTGGATAQPCRETDTSARDSSQPSTELRLEAAARQAHMVYPVEEFFSIREEKFLLTWPCAMDQATMSAVHTTSMTNWFHHCCCIWFVHNAWPTKFILISN